MEADPTHVDLVRVLDSILHLVDRARVVRDLLLLVRALLVLDEALVDSPSGRPRVPGREAVVGREQRCSDIRECKFD